MQIQKKFAPALLFFSVVVVSVLYPACNPDNDGGGDDLINNCYDQANTKQGLAISVDEANHAHVSFMAEPGQEYHWGYRILTYSNSATDETNAEDAVPEDSSEGEVVGDDGNEASPEETEVSNERTLDILFAKTQQEIHESGYTLIFAPASTCTVPSTPDPKTFVSQQLILPPGSANGIEIRTLNVNYLGDGGRSKGKGNVVVDDPISIH